jgi:hypothetical protein
VLALIHFYLGEEPLLTCKEGEVFDRVALLWGRVQFALQFEDKMRIKEIIRG